MRTIPRAPGFDHTLALLREGYAFIGNRCDALGSDVFRARLGLRPVVCMRGASAAEVFYEGDRFTRVGAMPVTVLKLLQDYGSVQLLDGADHRRRKAMFLDIGAPGEAVRLASQFAHEWRRALPAWQAARRTVLFDELRPMLTRAVTAWAGVPLSDREAPRRTREFSEMIEAAGSVGPRNWRALLLRARSERWARGVIDKARSGHIPAPPGSALAVIVAHRDDAGRPLDTKVAAVELLNVLRAVVAVARFIVYAAKALHQQPEARARIANGDEAYLEHFAQEVRRTGPFFPFIGGRVRRAFDWQGHRFEPGTWVLLDLYGTNLHPAIWRDPATFRPERFEAATPTPFELVPQGAGNVRTTHRCPGEHLTLELMKAGVRQLAAMRYTVPAQDLSIDLTRMPALPKCGFVMADPMPGQRESVFAGSVDGFG